MENLSFQYPAWYLIFCLMLGLAYALFVYFRSATFKEQSGWLNWLLGALRFLTVSSLAILLLSPLVKSLLTETRKPVVIFAQDQSESVVAEMDSISLNRYQSDYQMLKSELSSKYELHEYAFGSEVREGVDFDFSDKVSNLSEVFGSLFDLYSNQNLGAVVLATDGIYNQGSNPVYSSNRLGAPVFTVALGDTTPHKDLLVKRIYHNRIAYLDDRFKVEVDIQARNCAGSRTNLVVSKIEKGKATRLQNIPLDLNKEDFFTTREVTLEADQSGVQRWRFALTSVQGEVTTTNNVKDIFIDVLDARQKILIVAKSPHPDITAIKQSLERNKNYELTVEYAADFKGNPADYNFVILHQLPALNGVGRPLLQEVKSQKMPHLFVVGSQTDLNAFNTEQGLLTISGDGRNTNEVQAMIAPDFSLFTIDETVKNQLPDFAPVIAPFGEFKESAQAQILLYQRIGKVETQYPLLLLGEIGGMKTGVLAAEGIWKWRIFDYLQNQNHAIFEEILSKTIQYLTLKEDKRRFRVSLDKNIFNENEPAWFDAEVYNENYELVNDSDVSMLIRSAEGQEFPFTFDRTASAYRLNAGVLPVGNYRYTAKTTQAGKQLDFNGQFSVQPIQLESFERTADHAILRQLSEQYGGEMIYPEQLTQIATMIDGRDSVKPVIYQSTRTRSVIHLKWVFFLLLALLTLEWFLRRYHGSY